MIVNQLETILVLGSQGQIGRDLCEFLREQGKQVEEIDLVLSEEHDLRINQNSLLREKMSISDFVVFLAFDVGGAKYLNQNQNERDFLYNNLQIMQNVFEELQKQGVPFFFASSQMALLIESPYGNLKRIGEFLAKAIGGKSLRFWNVYGIEKHDIRSHAITDFLYSAHNSTEVNLMTNGQEERDFLHVRDASCAILTAIEHYHEMPDCVDVASFNWTSIEEVANIVANLFSAKVNLAETETISNFIRIDPRPHLLKYWQPKISLEDGIKSIAKSILR
jgi:nucleoside-diphosphate-sugar epimerase